MTKISIAALVFSLLASLSVPSTACSLMSCSVPPETEMRPDFQIFVSHDGKPLGGVSVEITTHTGSIRFSNVTAPDGAVRVTNLPPGGYWLKAELLGFSAAYECFQVLEEPTEGAKEQVSYTWGDGGLATSRVAGRIVDPQPGTGGTWLWNILHPVDVPIRAARLKLQNAITGEVFETKSDPDGVFSFNYSIPQGTYVLHIVGGAGRDYDPTDILLKLIEIYPPVDQNTLVLKRSPTGCGGMTLQPK